jgi:phenylalanyl-tRNA synthetase alpha chain
MKSRLQDIKREAESEIPSVKSEEDISSLKVKYLGRKGILTLLLRELSSLPPDERKEAGKSANELKSWIEDALNLKQKELRKKGIEGLKKGFFDITLPGKLPNIGSIHPLTKVLNEVVNIFIGMGFTVEEGPEIELDYYNFEALNIPKDHPARDMQDTFYITDDVILRTHTSPVQVRTMERHPPPLKVIAPGKVYRCDADITHSPMFHQVEGFIVDKDITFGDLKGVLELFVHQLFGKDIALRFRPSFFPFTEPSAEVDIRCVICKGLGCRVCKDTGWLEILGSGMIDPAVFSYVKYDPEEWTGFAFGMGIERIAMLKYGVDDIRLFFENDLRFLRQF